VRVADAGDQRPRSVFVVFAIATATISAFATSASAARIRADPRQVFYSVAVVEKAFGEVGIAFTSVINANSPRTYLGATVPHTSDAVTAIVVRPGADPELTANALLAHFASLYRYSGWAAVRKSNVIVVANRVSSRLGVKGPPLTMPSLVRKAISFLR
jgi:hypothetical protein